MKNISDTGARLRRTINAALLIWTAALLMNLPLASSLHAEELISGEVFVILASEETGPIDPSLAQIPALSKPPFNGFRSMQVLTRSAVSLSSGKAADLALPNNRRLSITLREKMPDGRNKVQVSITRPNEKDYLPLLEVIASPNEPFFVAGQKYQKGTLVIGVRIGNRTSPSR
jgi:hypothetical protein